MKLVVCFLLIFVLGLNGESEIPKMRFKTHFDHLSEKRHPLYKNGDPWREGRKYVKNVMHHYGSRDLREQVFNTTVAGKTVEGVNIIAVVEGLNKSGPVMVVGADYDTNLVSNHLKDNTGGIASLLEVMNIFYDRIYWNTYYLNYTVIFVAFDLNTREYQDSSMGRPGSYFFVHEWLLPYLNGLTSRGNKEFRGAIILDSVTTYNTHNDSQTLRAGFKEAMPDAYKEINARGRKGDFLGMVYTTREQNNSIVKTFEIEYRKDRKLRPYRLQEMELTLSFETLGDEVIELVNHQSHYHFWTYLENPLPAILLFDTDNDREDPQPCHVAYNCTVEEFLSPERTDFLTKTTSTIVSTILNLQTTRYEEKSGCLQVQLLTPLFAASLIASILSFLLNKNA